MLVVILIVLGLLLRALVAPLLLILTVVLSFAAALGVSAVVFNHLFGFANADPASRCSPSSSWWRWGSTTTSS